MQKLTMEQIRDLEEDPAILEENDRIEEEYHISMLAGCQEDRELHNDIRGAASKALRATYPLSRAEFFKKWG